jgi:hypothetical protein
MSCTRAQVRVNFRRRGGYFWGLAKEEKEKHPKLYSESRGQSVNQERMKGVEGDLCSSRPVIEAK